MKKFLLIILGLLLSVNAYAGIISYDTLSGDAGVSYSHLNSSFSTAYNEINGNIGSVNILNDSLLEADFADEINPRVRDGELIGNMTYSGMLPVTSDNLTSNVSAGVSYVNGYRVVTNITSKNYTASKDTYVYIDQNGAFPVEEVANDATAPTTPANSLLLAKVVTDTDNITSVTDLRQTTPLNLRIYQDLKSGLVISRDVATATTVTIGRGEIELGTTSKVRRNASSVNVDFTTTGAGGLDTGSLAAETYYYILALADSDNTTNYKGIASTSSTDAAGVTGERLVGWCYSQSASAISPDSVGAYRGLGGDAPNVVQRKSITNIVIDDTTYGTDFNETIMRMYTSGRPVLYTGTINILTPAGDPGLTSFVVNIDGVSVDTSEVSTYVIASGGAQFSALPISCILRPAAGTHTIKVQGKVAAASVTVDAFSLQAIEF